MKITNKLGLPEILVKAVANDPYSKGKSNVSVTTLINRPPYMVKLGNEYEPEFDVAQRLPALLGQAKHHVLERAGYEHSADVEQRLFFEINGWIVSGQYDLIEDDGLYDYKFTTVYSVIFNDMKPKKEWVAQLNLLRYLSHKNYPKKKINKIGVIAHFQDHSKMKAKQDSTYPQFPVMLFDIPLWTFEECEKYLLDKVKLHQEKDPPVCSDEERWKTEDKWAVMKKGMKRAVKLFTDELSAKKFLKDKDKNHYIEYRQGSYRRCEEYCDFSHVCPEYNDVIF